MKNIIILFSLFCFVHFLFAQNNHIQIGENIVYHQDLKFRYKDLTDRQKPLNFYRYFNPSLKYLHSFNNTPWGVGLTFYFTSFRVPSSRTLEKRLNSRTSAGADIYAYYNLKLSKHLFHVGLGPSYRMRQDEVTYQPESWWHSWTDVYNYNEIGLAIPASYIYQIGRHWNVGASAVGRLYFKQKSNTFSYGINMGCSF